MNIFTPCQAAPGHPIKSVREAMEYLKDHLVIIFQSKIDSSEEVQFISRKNAENRKNIGPRAELDSWNKFKTFNSIMVNECEDNGNTKLCYTIVIEYWSHGASGPTIPGDDLIVMFKVGETNDTNYPPPVGKPEVISDLKIGDSG